MPTDCRSSRALRVLVAEDEPLAAMVVEDVLTDLGHQVLLAPDGQAALEAAERAPFDVLVTDLAMPRLPGWELVRRLRARCPGLPVVVMTGYLPPGIAEALDASGTGPLTLLHKPFAIGALVAALGIVAPAPWQASATGGGQLAVPLAGRPLPCHH